ncbi:DUF2085 domain-containing protein [Candidatus Micrarchaeota archaeon]|nr:DUF2085 domain-containing protein [Candidatus Micrarchaeota archaeon]MBU1930417.1 DUF2085 domain-containing protein [Candidatus Micrarchaeota archaeon]
MGLIKKFVCHQKPERCFKIKKYTLPLCSRCTGVFMGIVIGLLTDFLRPLWEINAFFPTIAFMILILPIAADGLGQLWGLWKSNNAGRFITGLLAGLPTGATIRIILLFFVGI